MVRHYVKVVGPGRRQNYNESAVPLAMQAVKRGMSVRKAAEKYKLPNSTLNKMVKGIHKGKNGPPRALSDDEEEKLTSCILTCADERYPLKDRDLRLAVKGFLDGKGKRVKCFKQNLPGKEWVMSFLSRHDEIKNLKRARESISKENIREYFAHLSKGVEGVTPKCIINYDETSFTDDPGAVKVLTRKGVRRVERLMDHTKMSTSVMLAGAADGTCLPPYVVYKSKHLYDAWTEGGPQGCKFNRTNYGWFDQTTFEDWFETIVLPYCGRFDGPKLLIGDKLSSHFSRHVTSLCHENRIRFVFLPKNSNHICQPLDLSFFAPLKKEWKKTLDDWKINNKGTVQKAEFPSLLKRVLDAVGTNIKTNLISGFRATGIHPFNPQAVLRHFRKEVADEGNHSTMVQSIIDEVNKTAGTANQHRKKPHLEQREEDPLASEESNSEPGLKRYKMASPEDAEEMPVVKIENWPTDIPEDFGDESHSPFFETTAAVEPQDVRPTSVAPQVLANETTAGPQTSTNGRRGRPGSGSLRCQTVPKKTVSQNDDFEKELLNILKSNMATSKITTTTTSTPTDTQAILSDPDAMFLLSQLPYIKSLSSSDRLDFRIKFMQFLQSYINEVESRNTSEGNN